MIRMVCFSIQVLFQMDESIWQHYIKDSICSLFASCIALLYTNYSLKTAHIFTYFALIMELFYAEWPEFFMALEPDYSYWPGNPLRALRWGYQVCAQAQ